MEHWFSIYVLVITELAPELKQRLCQTPPNQAHSNWTLLQCEHQKCLLCLAVWESMMLL